MLSCKEITELATDYLENDLRRHERIRVQMHLWMCKHCQRYVKQMRKVVKLLNRLPKEPAPAERLDNLLARFRETHDKAK
jgi:predicted anti-sigma-YlaC factor YlaD